MKTKLRRNSARIIIGLMSVVLMISTLALGSIFTAEAGYSNHHIQYNNAGSGDVYFNSSGVAYITPTSTGTMAFQILRNDWGNDGWFGKSETVTDNGSTVYEVYQYNSNWPQISVVAGKKYKFQLTQEGSTVKYKVSSEWPECKLAWDVASGHDGNYNLDNYSTMSGSNGSYTYSMYMQGGTKYYMFMQIASSIYFRGTSKLTTSSAVTLYNYGTNNYGDSADKINFTPSSGGYYTFTWNHSNSQLSVAKSALPYSSKTFKISDGITNKWDSDATNTMSVTGTTRTFTYYLKHGENDVYFRMYNSSDSQIFGAETSDQKVSTSYSSSTRTNIGLQNSFLLDTDDLGNDGKYYAVQVSFGLTEQSNSGAVKYTATAKDNLTSDISANNTSYNVTNGSGGITFTGYATNLFNSSNVTYQFFKSTDNGATWTSVRSASSTSTYTWTPTSSDVGSYKFKVKVVDTTVNTSTNARSARVKESEAIDISVVEGQTYLVNKKYSVNGGTAVADGTAEIGDTSARATKLTFSLFRNSNNKRYKLTGFTVSGVTKKSEDLTTGEAYFYASAAGGTITANYATEADYKINYFKLPSGCSTPTAYLWGSNNIKNAAFPGIALSTTEGPASGAREDAYGVCDYLGSVSRTTGVTTTSTDTYYYYKTYCTDYTGIIFGYYSGDNFQQTADLSVATGDGKYYDTSTSSWKELPANKFYVSISATDTTTGRVNSNGAQSVTGTRSNESVAVNSSTGVQVSISAPSGYTLDTTTPLVCSSGVTVSGTSFSNSNGTYTFTVKSTQNGSITPNFVEISRTITVTPRKTAADNTVTYGTSATYTVGISSTAELSVPQTPTYYKQNKWMTSTPSGVTVTSGSLNSNLNITVRSTADATIYFEFAEDMHTVTFRNDGHGSVSKGTTTIVQPGASNSGTSSVGNITAYQFDANNSDGYDFDYWEVTAISGTLTVSDPNNTLSTITVSSIVATPNQSTQAILYQSSIKIKTTANVTLKAHFKPVDYSITADWKTTYANTNSKQITNTSGVIVGSGKIGDKFQIRVTLGAGYEVDKIEFAITGTDANGRDFVAPEGTNSTGLSTVTPSGSGSTKIYEYTLKAGSAKATITLKAAKPELSGYMKDNTAGFTTYRQSTSSTTNHTLSVDNYYKQPADLKADASSFSTISYTVNETVKNSGLSPDVNVTGTGTNHKTYIAPDFAPTTENGNRTYTVVITATNEKTGVTTKTTTCTITVTVTFNAEQKAYFKLKRLYDNSYEETNENSASYYDNATSQMEQYKQARNNVRPTYIAGYPGYNSTASTVRDAYNTFYGKFKDLQAKAKTTTVYVLSKYSNSNDNRKMSIYGSNNGTDLDWNHYKQYHYYLMGESATSGCIKDENDDANHLMTYEGKAGSTYYLYSYTYAGKANARFYITTAAGTTITTGTNGTSLSNTVTTLTALEKEYYVNLYNQSYGANTVNSSSDFVDLTPYRTTTDKKVVEKSSTTTYTGTQIKNMLGLNKKGSLKDEEPNIDIQEVSFTIQENPGNNDDLIDLLNNSWTPAKSGKYQVLYKVKYKNYTDARASAGATFEIEKPFYIYVAKEEVDVYVDMSDNPGTPTLKFSYTKNNTDYVLPCDMSLVSGSESIYKYRINLKKLNDGYGISYKSGNEMIPIEINNITVDKVAYNNGGSHFQIGKEAYASGDMWFKANSTPMSNFEAISCSSVNNTFRAIVDGTGAHIPDALEHVSGTGIISDDETEGIHDVKYAAYDKDSESINPAKNFGYVVKAEANSEVEISGNKYYFDCWKKIATPEGGTDSTYFTDSDNRNALTNAGKNNSLYEKRTYQITSAPELNSDTTYVAVYKPVSASSSTSGVARVEVNYKFKDYDTDDGNFEYDATKSLKDASYTKTLKVPFGSETSFQGTTYADYAAVRSAFRTIAKNNFPVIQSNYFDYSYPSTDTSTTTIDSDNSDESNCKLVVNANIPDDRTATNNVCTVAREYKIRLYKYDVSNSTVTEKITKTGKYQQTVTFTAEEAGLSGDNVNWYIKDGNNNIPLHNGSTFTTRFIQYGFTNNSATGNGDKLYIYAKSGTETVDKTSAILWSYNETYYDSASDTDKVRHNYYIVDYLDKSGSATLVGAGTMVASTTDGTNYKETNAAAVFNGTYNDKKSYIENALKSGSSATIDYDTEREQQTIKNISFRYIPYNSTNGKNILRYSDALKGYHYVYALQNAISNNYSGQTLRVYSFFIYEDGENKTIVISPTYAELTRTIE